MSVTDTDLLDLQDDISRADLFDLFVQPTEPVYSLRGPFTFPGDTTHDAVANKPRVNSIFGIDISHYTSSTIPLESLSKSNVRFVYLKCSQGKAAKDGKFAAFWARLGSAPLEARVHRGAYHFLSAGVDAAQQADSYLAVLAANGGIGPTDMPPALDLEWDVAVKNGPDRWIGHKPDEILKSALTWMEAVKASTGRSPILYTARAWWRERMGSESAFDQLSDYRTWIADYSSTNRGVEKPAVPNGAPWALWQFTSTAKLSAGFSDAFDASIFKGSEDDFLAAFELQKISP